MDYNSQNMISSEYEEELSSDRFKMLDVTKWFEKTITVELIAICYLGFSTFDYIALVAGLLYFIFINRKNKYLCAVFAVIHLVIAAFVIPSGIISIVDNYMNPSTDSDMMGFVLADKISIILSTFFNLIILPLPAYFNFKAVKYCKIHDELKFKPEYPYFDVRTIKNRIVNAEEDKKIKERLKKMKEFTDEEIDKASVEFISDPKFFEEAEPENQNPGEWFYEATHNEGAQYIKDMLAKFRIQITKTPENAYDYTVYSTYIVIAMGFLNPHISSIPNAFMEVLILLFVLLPKNRKLINAAFILHTLETAMVIGAGGVNIEGAEAYSINSGVYFFICLYTIVQAVLYFLTSRQFSYEYDMELEESRMKRRIIEALKNEQREKEINERVKKWERTYNDKVWQQQMDGIGLEEFEPSDEKRGEFFNADTELAAELLSDLNE